MGEHRIGELLFAARRWWPWLLLIGWSALQIVIASELDRQQRGPIDFLTYQIAARNVVSGKSPYRSEAEDLATWRAYHRLEQHLRDVDAPAPEVHPGPYLYPPTLALLIAHTGIGAVGFATIIVAAVGTFARIWLGASGLPGKSLLLVVLSWDIWAAVSGGNVELPLLAAIAAAARLLWSSQPLLAAPFIAFTLVVKPFYALFFATFLMMLFVARASPEPPRPRHAAAAAGLAVSLVGIEVIRWGAVLRADALAFVSNALGHQWFVLPVGEQTPMSIWNRTPMQGLINAGVSPSSAFILSLMLWGVLSAVTVWRGWKQPLRFAEVFAVTFVLLYVGRPVGWTLNYLEFIAIGALWPAAGPRLRRALILSAVVVMMSHWAALVLSVLRVNLWLFTLQTAAVPWESWTLVPLCWFVLVHRLLPRRMSSAGTVTS
jgi:hypothetical protein